MKNLYRKICTRIMRSWYICLLCYTHVCYYVLFPRSGYLLICFFSCGVLFSQQIKKNTDTLKIPEPIVLDAILVSAVRVTAETPVTFSNLDKTTLAKRNLGQDIPFLMNFMPSVVSTSDAGNAIGYSSIRVRGSDAKRVNITINGIPYNDSESQGTFWVNIPDFASSVENLQVQRGVGTSTNGAGAFGASVNILTDKTVETPQAEIANSIGSFNTRRHMVKFGTGRLNDHFELQGRLSVIKSDGYIDRAFSDLKSYFLQGNYTDENTFIKALVFGGTQQTYQAWNGIDAVTLKSNRQFNPAGLFTDQNGKVQFYENETDNYNQDHYQLHWNQKINAYWQTNLALHYTKGKGYYENYKEDAQFSSYGLEAIKIADTVINTTDLIRQKWLVNDFYGTTFSVQYAQEGVHFITGGGWNRYEGNHFGTVIWARYASNSENTTRYYDNDALKTDFNIFTKLGYELMEKWRVFVDLQYRTIYYNANSEEIGVIHDELHFFNPKAGFTYLLNKEHHFYFSYAIANREPGRSDYESGSVKPERLHDYELGWRLAKSAVQLNANVYYMRYKDQLVVTGALNEVGAPITTNSGTSYRLGLEVDASYMPIQQFIIRPNIALSQNKNLNFYEEREGNLVSLGTTNIAFSPTIVLGNVITYVPKEQLEFSILSKFVGSQYMGNTNAPDSKLPNYFTNDLNIIYSLKPKKVVQSIVITALLNNIFDVKYVSNGHYDSNYGAYFYPQAGINGLIGLQLNF